jgi:hypothetical protein
MIADSLSALVAYLSAQAEVSGLVAGRVYGAELPAVEVPSMPRHVILVRWAGGSGTLVQARLHSGRVDVWSYGITPFEANRLWRSVYPALKSLDRRVYAQTLLHGLREAGGPMNVREPATEWPAVIQSWQILAADVAVS